MPVNPTTWQMEVGDQEEYGLESRLGKKVSNTTSAKQARYGVVPGEA
jgi:hypothetical protein